MKQRSWFEKFSKIAAKSSGNSGTFVIACTAVGI
jgi:low affinity Fe/Cu permease